jgi:nucleotide-binding universal stress UspA family protein
MKNILVLIHDDPGQEARLQCALDVARAVEGHLTCLDVATMPVLLADYHTQYSEAVVLEEELKREQANRQRLEPRLRNEQVPYSWEEATGDPVESLLAAARLNDLIVVGSHGKVGEGDKGDIAARIVRRAARPILAVPHGAKALDLSGTALVAWDGSDPAEAALRAAVPLLKLAERVVLVAIDKDRASCEPAAAYCAREDVSVHLEVAPRGSGRVADELLDRIRLESADWLTMGAYGHSPLREALFGGTTRAMLKESPVPLFLAAS